MKSLVYITAYATTPEKQRLLLKCIRAVKSFKMDIMVVSHAPLPEHIIKETDFYIYDKDNRFNKIWGTIVWKQLNNIRINRYVGYSHQYPIIRLLRNAFHLAKGNSYDFCWGTDFDNIYSEEDIQKLIKLQERMVLEDKKFILFYPKEASWKINDTVFTGEFYDLFIMGGYVNAWVDMFDAYFPMTLEEYNTFVLEHKANEPQSLEYYIYDALRYRQTDVLQIDGYIKDYLTSSSINTSSLVNMSVMVLPANNGKHYLCINHDATTESLVKVYINGELLEEHMLSGTSMERSFRLIELQTSCDISVTVFQENVMVDTHNINYRTEDAHIYEKSGSIIITT